MTLIYYYKMREVHKMKRDLKKENKDHLDNLSKVTTLHAQNFELGQH